MLDELHDRIPFDAAWMALAEPDGTGYTSIASVHLDRASVRYLSGQQMARDIEATGADRERPPSLSDVPFSSSDLQTWAERLLPAGFHETLSTALLEAGGRHVGFLTLFFQSADPPSWTVRRQLARSVPKLASGIDVVRALGASAVLVGGARAGVVLLPGRGVIRLPGLPDDELFSPGSALVPAARDALEEAEHASFLWPRGDRRTPDGLVQVTALACDRELGAVASGIVVLSPAPHLRGLTPRELEVLGHVIEGCSNLEIARALGVAPRTVAAHVEHILVKLDAPSRTLAAVRAERAGLYVPLAGAGGW
jgi:DNA-binding CsgD family transcriptional regulator